MTAPASAPAAAQAPAPARRFNFWVWLPVFVIGAAAIANTAIIIVARQVNPTRVEAQPWLASGLIDQQHEKARRFAAGGWTFALAPTATGARCSLGGGSGDPGRLAVGVYRPDDAKLDQLEPWPDHTRPLELVLTRPGAWRVTLLCDGAVVCEGAIERR